jgi:hypothetical protein
MALACEPPHTHHSPAPQLVQFVSVRVNRVLLMALRYSSGQYFTHDFTAVAPVTVPDDQYNPNSKPLLDLLASDYPNLRLEYDAMLSVFSA